jgi:hypothetical protein
MKTIFVPSEDFYKSRLFKAIVVINMLGITAIAVRLLSFA